jgi:hypothetical protein
MSEYVKDRQDPRNVPDPGKTDRTKIDDTFVVLFHVGRSVLLPRTTSAPTTAARWARDSCAGMPSPVLGMARSSISAPELALAMPATEATVDARSQDRRRRHLCKA